MGFLELRWGAAKEEAPVTAPVATTPPPKLEEALKIIKESYAEAQNPVHSAADKAAKLTWVGGAIRIYSLIAGRESGTVLAEVIAAVPAASAAPTPTVNPDPVLKMTRPEDRTNRPPRPPGAQRPLTPEELAQPPARPDEGVTITTSTVRRSAD